MRHAVNVVSIATDFLHMQPIARSFRILIGKETGPNLDTLPDLTVARQFHIATLRQDCKYFDVDLGSCLTCWCIAVTLVTLAVLS